MPAALTYSIADERYNWDYHTVPQKNLNNRKIHQPRGRVLGGSSSINAMVYVRGHPLDFERWDKKENAPGWGYADVLPYFKKAQNHQKGENKYRGGSGPLYVRSYYPEEVTNVLFKVFGEAGVEAGYPKTEDINGYSQEGFGPFDMTIGPNGVRCSTAVAYLHPALKRSKDKNLFLFTHTTISKVVFDRKNGDSGEPVAVGVETYNKKTKERKFIKAKKEVILSLGAIGSPQVLMLSGIGDAAHLRDVGIISDKEKPYIDNPEIGKNFQDHLEVYLQYRCTKPVTLYPVGNWSIRHFHKRAIVGIEWFTRGSGIGASNQFEIGGFVRSKAGIEHPDIQYHFIPGCVLGQLDFLPEHGFQVHVGTLRPTSRGTVKLASKDPLQAPLIDPNYFETEEDVVDMRNALRLADEVIQQKAFSEYRGERIRPTLVECDIKDDKKVDEWLKESSHSAYHPSCSVAMGRAVDSQGRVLGAKNLRVVDASIMPSMTSGNLNSPTIMIAEKIADNILGKTPLPRITDAPYYVNENWQTKQR